MPTARQTANLFYSTGIPVCILVLKKCKKPNDVLFINATEHFDKGERQNQLSKQHIAPPRRGARIESGSCFSQIGSPLITRAPGFSICHLHPPLYHCASDTLH